jgi:cell division protease FtsH
MQQNIYKQQNPRVGMLSIAIVLLMVTTSACSGFLKTKSQEPSISYDVFLIKVKQGEIEKLGLTADRSQALIHNKNGTKEIVNLPADPQLVDMLVKNVKGGIYILPANFNK